MPAEKADCDYSTDHMFCLISSAVLQMQEERAVFLHFFVPLRQQAVVMPMLILWKHKTAKQVSKHQNTYKSANGCNNSGLMERLLQSSHLQSDLTTCNNSGLMKRPLSVQLLYRVKRAFVGLDAPCTRCRGWALHGRLLAPPRAAARPACPARGDAHRGPVLSGRRRRCRGPT